jgi:hypothetical protein
MKLLRTLRDNNLIGFLVLKIFNATTNAREILIYVYCTSPFISLLRLFMTHILSFLIIRQTRLNVEGCQLMDQSEMCGQFYVVRPRKFCL